MEITTELLQERLAEHFPVEKEEKIPTLGSPLIIESACPGWQVGGDRFPAVPCSIEEQVKEIVDSVKAGAIAIHVHPRNPETCMARVDPKLLSQILERVFDEVDCVTLSHTWAAKEEADYITETEELLEYGKGNKYCQGSVVLPIHYLSATGALQTVRCLAEGVEWLEKNSVKPIYQLYDSFSHFGFKQHLLDSGLSTWKPYVLNLHLGKHHSHAIHKDPWSYLNLITNMGMVKETIPDSIVGVYPGGRNWFPITVMGLLLGSKLVRVGIEDCYWVYPHKDEVIKKNSDVVKLIVEIANLLQRPVVTDANEAREILGMKLTSKP
jgi:3-keto-5-aminohexanoate cleavage enzyme